MGTRVFGSSRRPVVASSPETIEAPTGTNASLEVAGPALAPAQPIIPSTRAGRTWTRVLPALILLAIILVFVLENLAPAKVRFVGLSARLPLAVALLAASALGSLVVLALGSVRIIQLRKLVRRSSASTHGESS